MDEWTKVQKKKWAPICKAAIDYLNKSVPGKIVAIREGADPVSSEKGKISQRALAQILDIFPQNFHKIEKGKIYGGNNMTLEQAIKLSLFYGCSIDYIAKPNQALIPSGETNSLLRDQLNTEKRMNEILTNRVKELESENAVLRAKKGK